MSTANTGWLKDNNGEKFAPKTLSSQVITESGETLDGVLDKYDFVIEEGTKQSGTDPSKSVMYRKWESGVLECWVSNDYSVAVSTAWGSLYYGTVGHIPLINDLVSVYDVVVHASQSSGNIWVTSGNVEISPSARQLSSVYVISPVQNASVNFTINAYIKGRWKGSSSTGK
jgi:hypothetical protein